MSVDPRETENMARLLSIMNGAPQPTAETAASYLAEQGPTLPITSTAHGNPGAAAMKDILERFYGASSKAAKALAEEAPLSKEVRHALVTERTETGAKVGSWEIRVNQVSEKLKTYDVRNVHTSESIASDLRLYEAAHALVKLFNSGVGINTTRVREILETEETFCKNYLDAVSFKRKMHRMEQLNESHKHAIAEDRYQEARARALAAREKLRKIDCDL